MLVRNLGAVAGLALVAEAFIIPSTISVPEFSDEASTVFFGGEADEGDYSIVPIPNDLGEALKAIQIGVSAIDGIQTSGYVYLACPECKPVPSADADVQCSSTSIYLDFKTSEDLKALELNGQHFYPLDAWKPYFKIKKMSVYGPVAVFADVSDIRSLLEERSIEAADDTDALIIDLVFQIWALDGTPVSVDSVHLRLLKDPSGNLQLVDLVKAAPIPTITPTMEFIEFIDADTEDLIEGVVVDIPIEETCGEGMSLSAIFCRVQSYVKQKVEDWHLKQPSDSFAPCSNETRAYDEFVSLTRPIIHGGIPKYAEQPDFDHDEIPHAGNHWHTHGHGYENEYSFLHKFASFIRNFVVGFLAPVFIGIVAGLTASVLGMLVGTCIAWLWIKLVRGGRRGNLSANQEARAREVANDDDLVDEKEVLLDHAPTMDDVEAPPVYIEKE